MGESETERLVAEGLAEVAGATTLAELDEVRRRHAGKKSPIKALLKNLKEVSAEERPVVAARLNEAQARLDDAIVQRQAQLERAETEARLRAEWMDLTLPGVATPRGAPHPIAEVEEHLLQLLRQLGFERVDGLEVEHPFYNFDALNIPEHHPARDMQDTFWVTGGWLLRSHTTTVQARVLEARKDLPIKVASLGRVYRNEAVDATHTAMFHQFEGIWVEEGLTFAQLKGTLRFLAKNLYGDRPIRFKPKFYPYTEPSVGVDLQCGTCAGSRLGADGHACPACHGAGWVTILGAGMIHRRVFEVFGFDPARVSGIAFGLGTTRMAAQLAGLSRSKALYEQDLRLFRRLHRGDA